MDLSDVISTHCQRYFDNQPLSPNAWSPSWRDYQPNLVECSNEEYMPEDLFDYYILVESLINEDTEGSASSQAGGSSSTSEDDFGKHLSDILNSLKFQHSLEAGSKSSASGGPVKNINWADFETSYLAKVQSRHSANPNKDAKPDLLSQLKSDWNAVTNVTLKPNSFVQDYKDSELYRECKQCSGKLSNASWSTKSSPSQSNDFTQNIGSAKTLAFPRMLDGVETRLNSSRGSDKSTNRTNLAGNIPPVNHNGLDGVNDLKNSLSGLHSNENGFSTSVNGFKDSLNGFGYSALGSNVIVDNKLISSKTVNNTKGFNNSLVTGYNTVNGFKVTGTSRNMGVNTILPIKSKHVNGNLGKKANVQSFRNQLINSQALNRQILSNQFLNSQFPASQMLCNPNVYNAPAFNVYRSLAYNDDYFVSGYYVHPNAYIHPDLVTSPGYVHNGYYDNYRYPRPGKSVSKPHYQCKPLKARPVRKKKGKHDFYAVPSLKGVEFDRATDYLKQTLLSLYRDQIMPVYFNVRGRFLEFNNDDIAPEHIIDICIRKPDVFNVISNGSLNDTYIYLVDEPEWFIGWVDRNDLTDVYSTEVWEQFFDFIKGYKDEEGNEQFPGSIYGMSKVMRKLKLPFIEGMTLGTICHIIQLAIRLKNFLFYEVKALKPTETVKNNRFCDIVDSLPMVDPGKGPSDSKDKASPRTNESAVSAEGTALKRVNNGV
ncbi:hypothetical protein MACJ_002989 [Theileria orientalis]|uniref:OST-HTH associated domain-containing protein n=1 Tax=Theileria orientalis TaxID=68886 RepID=A0A976M765_THEOR|nr:hypothetical protein MACJ_002989 [Theileria orientalis]